MIVPSRHTNDRWLDFVQNEAGDLKQKALVTTVLFETVVERYYAGERPQKTQKHPLN